MLYCVARSRPIPLCCVGCAGMGTVALFYLCDIKYTQRYCLSYIELINDTTLNVNDVSYHLDFSFRKM